MNGYAIENANNIISSLQTKLLNTSNEFKDILELRTKIMREQKLRKEQYTSAGTNLNGSNPSSLTSSPHLFGSRIMSKISTPLSRSNSSSPAPPTPSTTTGVPSSDINASLRSNSSDINPAANSIPMNSFTPPPQVMQQTMPSNTNSASNSNSNLLNPFPISQQPSQPHYNQGIAYSNSFSYGGGNGPERRNVAGSKNPDELLVISVDDDDDNGKGKSGSYPYAQQQQQQQQQQLYEPYSQSYLDSRSSAIDAIESTMAELGQIYQNFTHILAGQRETIQRIDDDILNVDMNVSGAQDYLMKYYKSISSNRWLIIKILIVILIFFFIFVVFL
ncbi:t-SNARE [Piromyces finnis]|uniref:t-SNARE n=1 Tax=Piromyces finnis TaxID=1754191 RepID=A0A1Y1VDF9_9FUNG|nr:t-SNARE [Piromyces finnis]|eukprot:ORX52921.1 t-SNARE [Piromyces finnis]